jgi:hypothetical protein
VLGVWPKKFRLSMSSPQSPVRRAAAMLTLLVSFNIQDKKMLNYYFLFNYAFLTSYYNILVGNIATKRLLEKPGVCVRIILK